MVSAYVRSCEAMKNKPVEEPVVIEAFRWMGIIFKQNKGQKMNFYLAVIIGLIAIISFLLWVLTMIVLK